MPFSPPQGLRSVSRSVRAWKLGVPAVIAVALLTAAAVDAARPAPRSEPAGLAYVPQLAAEPAVPVGAARAESSVTVLAAGDVASCDSDGDERSAAILGEYPQAPILAVGDLAYTDGTPQQFRDCFDPSWGQFKSRMRPVPGNHEYYSANAGPYFAYFGAAAGPAGNSASRGYYSFDVGAWHVVALNSEQDIAPDGAQLAWLRADLAAHPDQCVLAYWHRPRFTAGSEYPAGFADVQPFWETLSEAGAEIVLNGHDHSYQRYQPMDASGNFDPAGMREFVVGTGGRAGHSLIPDPRREAAHASPGFAGVLRLQLSETGYEWTFLSAAGDGFSDSGSASCN